MKSIYGDQHQQQQASPLRESSKFGNRTCESGDMSWIVQVPCVPDTNR